MARIYCFDLCLRFENLLLGSPVRTSLEPITLDFVKYLSPATILMNKHTLMESAHGKDLT